MIKKIINNAYVFSLGTRVFSVVLGFVYSVIYSRYLGAELRGVGTIVNNYGDVLSLLMCFGMFQGYPFFKQRVKKDIYENFINNVFALTIVFLLACIALTIALPLNTYLKVALLVSPIWMCSRQLNYVLLIENPKLSNIGNLILDIVDLFIIAFLFFFTKANLKWCFFIVSFKQILFFLICIKNIHFKKLRFKPSLKGASTYIKYGIVPMLTILLMEINYKLDVLMLEWYRIPISTIGIYSLGVMLAQKVWMIPDALKDVLMSKLANGKDANEVAKISRISFFITFISELFVLMFGKFLIRVIYGSEFEDAFFITIVIFLGVIGMVFYKMIYSYNVINGNKNINLLLLGFSAIVNLVLNIVLIPSFGSYGAAFSSLISYSACGLTFLMYFNRKTKIPVKDIVFVKKQDFMFVAEHLRINNTSMKNNPNQ